LGVTILIASQFYVVSNSNHEFIHTMHSGIKPLKGLLLPSIITILYRKYKK
jgi:hypothetical protein